MIGPRWVVLNTKKQKFMLADYRYADLMDDDVFKLVFGQESSDVLLSEEYDKAQRVPRSPHS